MRPHHYTFAHKVLPLDATTHPATWDVISSDQAHGYLQMRWSDAAPATGALPAKGLMWVEPVRAFGAEIRVVRMPPPEDTTEAYYGAIARSEDGAIRYFVCEKGAASVYWAEWRRDMRVRGEALVETAPLEVSKVFTEAPSSAAPWEISSSAIPGMPYLASFLMAVCQEMTNAQANADAKQALAAGPRTARVAPPATQRGLGSREAKLAIAAIVVAIGLVLVKLYA